MLDIISIYSPNSLLISASMHAEHVSTFRPGNINNAILLPLSWQHYLCVALPKVVERQKQISSMRLYAGYGRRHVQQCRAAQKDQAEGWQINRYQKGQNKQQARQA